DAPTEVTIQLYILALDSLNEITMDYSIHLYLRQSWNDRRLDFGNHTNSFDRLELSQKVIDKAWIPDTYFVDEKNAVLHDVTIPNRLMHIYRNGTVMYNGYSTEYVKYNWEKNSPIKFAPDLPMARFQLKREPKVRSYHRDYWQVGGKFSCLEGKLHFIRRSGYYVIQIFGPSILIVMLSWVSFWLDPEASPARISLGILSVLNMTTASNSARSSLPKVSYVKAIDVWMATCLFFVFAALIHFAFVNVLARRQKRRMSEKLRSLQYALTDFTLIFITLLADIFLYSYDAEFIQSLVSEGKRYLASDFNFTYRYIDDVLSLNNPKFADYLSSIYPSELEVKETTETNNSASYLDIMLSYDTDGHMNTLLYDKRDDFNFSITNFPFLSSNIPSSPAYGVFISQLIRYARASTKYTDFVLRARRLSDKLLSQGYVCDRLTWSLRKFYGRYGELVIHYDVPLSRMVDDILS
ncbi:hypothetical protein FSP39_015107, partial [Pinctada imbricata]